MKRYNSLPDLTLGRARRILAKKGELAFGPKGQWIFKRSIPVLDQVISVLGPKSQLTSEIWRHLREESAKPPEDRIRFAPKGTDEALEASESPSEDATMHGGDGNSGECDHSAASPATGPRNQAEGGELQPQHSPGSPTTQADDDQPVARHDLGVTTQEPGIRKDRTRSDGSEDPRSFDEADRDDRIETLGAPQTLQARGSGVKDQDSDSSKSIPPSSSRNDRDRLEEYASDVSSRGRDPGYGGDFRSRKDWDEVLRNAPAEERRGAKEVRRALERLIHRIVPGQTQPIPRLDARKLAFEVTSRRLSLVRASKVAGDRPYVVLIADCSGSCSAVCDETLLACRLIAEHDPRVVVLETSNSEVLGVAGGQPRKIADHLNHRFQLKNIGLVVVWGDGDGASEYQQLVEAGIPLVWLDSYAASTGVVKPASRNLRRQAQSWTRQPLAWFQGVNSSQSAAIALRQVAARK